MNLVADVRATFAEPPPAWVAAFLEDPVDSLTALFTGRWYHGSLNAEDPERLLLDWVRGLSSVEGFPELVDASMAAWIERSWGAVSDGDRPELAWHRGLLVAATLHDELPRTIAELQTRRDDAPGFLGAMTRAVTLDPMGWYWTCLAERQDNEELHEQWWALAELMPGTPWFHGRIGLLGLRRIPGPDLGGFRESAASALLRLSRALDSQVDARILKQSLAQRAARAAARELRRAYPFPASWDAFWGAHHGELEERPRGWLTAVLGEPAPPRKRRSSRRAQIVTFDRSWPDRARAIAHRLREGDSDGLDDALALIDEQERFTSATGDYNGTVKTLCQLSAAALRLNPTVALTWAEAARRWDPWNAFAWTSAVRAHSSLGADDLALNMSLQASERFPENVVARNGLAETLKAQGKLDAAETTYRDTINRFPNDVVTRNGLAALLRHRAARDAAGGPEAAEQTGSLPGAATEARPLAADPPSDPAPSDAGTEGQPPAAAKERASHLPSDDERAPIRCLQNVRSMLLLARLSSGGARAALLEVTRVQIEEQLEREPQRIELLFTKVELLLDQEQHDEARGLLRSLPHYLAQRPEFLALEGRLALDELRDRPAQRYDPAQLEPVLQPWEAAGRLHSALELNVPMVRLRASSLVYDGEVLDEVRRDTIKDLHAMVRRRDEELAQPGRQPHRNAVLRMWWRERLASALPALDATDEELSYKDMESLLTEQPELLDRLERELVDASRYTSSVV